MTNMIPPSQYRSYLIQSLAKDCNPNESISIPAEEAEQAQLIRALMNLRPPIPATDEFLAIQDAYLSEEIKKRGVIDSASLTAVPLDRRIYLWQGDITRLQIEAIVNAANSALLGCWQPCHSCIDNIIHSFAGVQLRLACHDIMQAQGHEEPAGTAKITLGYNLPCKYILHTVGPIINGPLQQADRACLASCYRACLDLAAQNHLTSIAFCCISTGVFHFPQKEAAKIAINTVLDFLKQNQTIQQVVFNVFTNTDLSIYRQLLFSEEQ